MMSARDGYPGLKTNDNRMLINMHNLNMNPLSI